MLEIEFNHVTNDLINRVYVMETLDAETWVSFLVGEHTDVAEG